MSAQQDDVPLALRDQFPPEETRPAVLSGQQATEQSGPATLPSQQSVEMPLRPEINRSRMEEVPFKIENAKRRAFCMIYNRLRGYAKACKDFCNERRHTGRKHMLPAALHTKRCLVKVQQHGEYVIHGAVEKRAKKATQG